MDFSYSLMPSLYEVEKNTPPTTVMVTGATGYIAANLVLRLLASGHTVHGTVRDMKKAADLLAFPGAAERLKLFVADLNQPDSFNEAIQGCSYVFHTASPFTWQYEGHTAAILQAQFVDPAVHGTQAVLEAVNRTPSVKRVVMTATVGTIAHSVYDKPVGYVFSERDWNDRSTVTDQPYSYSKTQAEKKAWQMCKAQDRWTLVTIHPAFVVGPPMTTRKDGSSIRMLTDIFHNKFATPPAITCGVVDVRDVAAAHCLAAFHPNAQGRYILSKESMTAKQIAGLVHELYPKTVRRPLFTMPKTVVYVLAPLLGLPRDFVKWWVGPLILYSHDKVEKELGLNFLPLKQTFKDTAEAMARMNMITIRD